MHDTLTTVGRPLLPLRYDPTAALGDVNGNPVSSHPQGDQTSVAAAQSSVEHAPAVITPVYVRPSAANASAPLVQLSPSSVEVMLVNYGAFSPGRNFRPVESDPDQ